MDTLSLAQTSSPNAISFSGKTFEINRRKIGIDAKDKEHAQALLNAHEDAGFKVNYALTV